MAVTARYFGRKYKLTFDLKGKTYTFETKEGQPAMDIKFDVTYARGQTAREGSISILGLGRGVINKFISLAAETRGKAMKELVRVKLEAGYFTSAGMVEILDGFAWYATVTAPPQMWLNIKVSEYNPMGGRVVDPFSVSGTTLYQMLSSILKKFESVEGEKFAIQDKTQEKILDKETGKNIEFKEKVSLKDALSYFNLNASDKVQVILRTVRQSNGTRTVEAHDKATDKVYKSKAAQVDGKHGLLSVTGIDAVNGCVTTFLDGAIPDELTHLNLKSELNPQANGTYYIIKKQYVGQFMGQEWYVRYFCSDRKKTK